MNSRIRFIFAGAACAALCASVLAVVPGSAGESPVAPVDSPIAGPAPSEGYVWMSGHWDSQGGQWKWVAAHWELPPSRSATWVGGHWVPSAGGWTWVNGAWNIADGQQAQGGPPQPPGQDTAAMNGVPSPATPAPMVGQYGPGGVERDADQPSAPVDYGIVDYSPAYYPAYGYPGYAYPYAWAGDPYYWGFPGIALGFGWGPGFVGWGRGGYGFRGHGGYFGHGGGFARGGGIAHGGTGHFGR
jgi:hypothetical protein